MSELERPPLDPLPLLEVLARHAVRYVLIGGVAAVTRGYPLPTYDLDITPQADPVNLDRLAAALRELGARLRVPADPAGVAFPVDAEMLASAAAWTLTTTYGDLDIILTPTGTAGYEDLARAATRLQLGAVRVEVAALADVIRNKEAVGRPKDLAQLPALRRTMELEARRGRPE